MAVYTVTQIVRQQRARHRVSIFLDGEFAFGATEDIVYRFSLAKGVVLDESTLAAIKDDVAFFEAKEQAMRFLARRAHSAAELRRKLQQKKIEPRAIDAVIAHLRAIGLLDDEAFARAFIADRVRLKMEGKTKLAIELKKRGVAEPIVATLLDELLPSDETELERAQEFAIKAASRLTRYDAATRKRRLIAQMMRKGFGYEIAKKVIAKVVDESDSDGGFSEND